MHRVALKITGNVDNASDIVQEVFVCLFDSLQHGRAIHFPSTWLYKATINKCCDHLRKQKRFEPIESAKNTETHDKPIEINEITAIVQKALLQLKPHERVVLSLYSEGLSYKEIADASGVKFTSMGKTISRLLEKLEKELKSLHYELY